MKKKKFFKSIGDLIDEAGLSRDRGTRIIGELNEFGLLDVQRAGKSKSVRLSDDDRVHKMVENLETAKELLDEVKNEQFV